MPQTAAEAKALGIKDGEVIQAGFYLGGNLVAADSFIFKAVDREANTFEPAYTAVNGKVDEPAKVASPSFTDKAGNTATPTRVSYKLGADAPAGAVVNDDGSVTYTPQAGEEGTAVSIPV